MPRRREDAWRLRVVDVGRQRAWRGGAWGPRGPWGPCPEERQRRGAGSRRARNRCDDLRDLARAEHGVDLRDLGAKLIAISLGQASGHDQSAAGAVLLPLRHLEDGVDRLLLGGVDERARVDHEHLGRRGILCELVARVPREPEHHLGIDEVLGTAERDETDLHEFWGLAGGRALGILRSALIAALLSAVLLSAWLCIVPSNQGYNRFSMRGYGIVSRTCSRPQIHATTRSMPMPKPPCGTEP